MIKKYLDLDNRHFFRIADDLTEENSDLKLRCDYDDIVSGKCPMKEPSGDHHDDLCPSNYVPALVHGTTIIVINNGLIANAGLTSEKLKNMISSGAITCVPVEMSSAKPTTTPPPVTTSSSSSSSDEINKMILLLLLNLLNQNKNNINSNVDKVANPCPTCSCKNCGPSPSSPLSGTDNAFSQLANAIIGMEQLKFDLIKNKINTDAQLLGSKLNIDMNLIKTKMGFQQALANALLGSLNSLGSGQGSSHKKDSPQKDSPEEKSLDNNK